MVLLLRDTNIFANQEKNIYSVSTLSEGPAQERIF